MFETEIFGPCLVLKGGGGGGAGGRASCPCPSPLPLLHSGCTPVYLSVLFIALRKETPTKDLALHKQPFPDVYKKDLVKNFLKLTGKHLYRSL